MAVSRRHSMPEIQNKGVVDSTGSQQLWTLDSSLLNSGSGMRVILGERVTKSATDIARDVVTSTQEARLCIDIEQPC